jgi:hypothetical protein
MSFQAYLDNIKEKTGKTADDFKTMAAEKGLIKTAEIVCWLKLDFGLGHGHAMAIVHLIVHKEHLNASPDVRVGKLFSGDKENWRKSYDFLIGKLSAFGADVSTSAGQTYINMLRGGKKFAIVQPSSSERLDIGIKLKGTAAGGRFEETGKWNAMVTHRIRITHPDQIDGEVINWLKMAYVAA